MMKNKIGNAVKFYTAHLEERRNKKVVWTMVLAVVATDKIEMLWQSSQKYRQA